MIIVMWWNITEEAGSSLYEWLNIYKIWGTAMYARYLSTDVSSTYHGDYSNVYCFIINFYFYFSPACQVTLTR